MQLSLSFYPIDVDVLTRALACRAVSKVSNLKTLVRQSGQRVLGCHVNYFIDRSTSHS